MLLKRVEKEGKIKSIFESSNILASTYDTETKDLILIFKKGGQYRYPQVKMTDYTRFETADSQGVIFNSHIKKYSFVKMDAIDPTKIVESIELVIAEDKIKVGEEIVNTMHGFIADSQMYQKFPSNHKTYFDKLSNLFKQYTA